MRDINSSPRALVTGDHRSYGLSWELPRHGHCPPCCTTWSSQITVKWRVIELGEVSSQGNTCWPSLLSLPLCPNFLFSLILHIFPPLSGNFSCPITVVFQSVLCEVKHIALATSFCECFLSGMSLSLIFELLCSFFCLLCDRSLDSNSKKLYNVNIMIFKNPSMDNFHIWSPKYLGNYSSRCSSNPTQVL